MNDINYRDATAADCDAIAALHADSWRRHYRGSFSDAYLDGDIDTDRRAVWRERLHRPQPTQLVIVVEAEGRLAGFVCAFRRQHAVWGTLIDNLHVRADLKRGGVGRALMKNAGVALQSVEPDCGVYLSVLHENTDAQAFYARIGGLDAVTEMEDTPDGGRCLCHTITWESPAALVAGCG